MCMKWNSLSEKSIHTLENKVLMHQCAIAINKNVKLQMWNVKLVAQAQLIIMELKFFIEKLNIARSATNSKFVIPNL